MAIGLTPLGDQFIVQPDPDETHVGGMELPTPQRRQTGTVVAVGPQVRPPIRPGARVMWLYDPATRFKLNGSEYLRLQDIDIVGVLNQET